MKRLVDLPCVRFGDLNDIEQRAILAATSIRHMAYSPYFKYKVGVAVVSVTDKIYTGVNVENCAAVVPHAEWNALSEMVKNGERQFKVLVCVAQNGGIPCSICRQFMREFSGDNLEEVVVIGVGQQGGDIIRCAFADIIGVDSFSPRSLGVNPLEH
ncbi:cytidine deaminase [Candidatus Jorgensenbacteria bacterium]|nr:cytidine deaminase [Candidatus Jorgensenbacteria bacterium]